MNVLKQYLKGVDSERKAKEREREREMREEMREEMKKQSVSQVLHYHQRGPELRRLRESKDHFIEKPYDLQRLLTRMERTYLDAVVSKQAS